MTVVSSNFLCPNETHIGITLYFVIFIKPFSYCEGLIHPVGLKESIKAGASKAATSKCLGLLLNSRRLILFFRGVQFNVKGFPPAGSCKWVVNSAPWTVRS